MSGTERCDKVMHLIDQALAGPDPRSHIGRQCWHCVSSVHNDGPSGLCDVCLEKLRDPELTSERPHTGTPSDNEDPGCLDGAYTHRRLP